IDGVLFINNRNVDSGLTLKQTYIASISEANKLDDKWLANPENAYPVQGTDSIRLKLETAVYTSKGIRGRLAIDTSVLPQTATVFGHSWTFDNFGPLRVPADKYFVLGDNRHESADSRILGFVDAKDFLGVVVKIF